MNAGAGSQLKSGALARQQPVDDGAKRSVGLLGGMHVRSFPAPLVAPAGLAVQG